ncbi:hypothetical protein M670_00142 [Schinkia azotoformans MEV2011]|uniref:Uncharacterized protein n=1 Tax=Schinkia azotoformans MEV2011 TaxID=1348973 RepID=A0A072NSE3_SCHAZ|nr:hypothetical protein [Schinkia azotoformans]KEF40127.1 hypothetical protein M670_00142 [Schinkia azotoformans MEV2011]
MNFDTKYLVRWGIPGWIMLLTLFPYLFITYYSIFKEIFKLSAVDILTIGAALTFLGVPLGYILNQIHHSLFWVIIKCFDWNKYFKEEVHVEENHLMKCDFKKERYRYLLSKKHEVGSVMVSFIISWLVILLTNLNYNNEKWAWIYFAIVSFLTVMFIFNRNYSSKNVHYYFYNYLLNKSKK